MSTTDQAAAALLAEAPPALRDHRLASSAVIASLICLALMLPFARVPLAQVPAFIPAYEAALMLNDLITAVLLFGQFSRSRRLSVLAAGCAYLFSVAIVLMHALSFPGVFAPAGLMGGGNQTTAWLYVLWHAGFPACLIIYGLLAGTARDRLSPHASSGRALVVATLAALALAAIFTLASTVFVSSLPVIVTNGDYSRMVILGISPAIVVITLVALLCIWRRRSATLLDIWLFAVLWVWLCDVALSAVVGSSRFDLGWYAGRLFGLLAASFVLVSLLVESNQLYARLATALAEAEARNVELVRSRSELARVQRLEAVGQLTGGIAHDFNNLLTAILGALQLIARKPDDHARVARLADNASKAVHRGARLVRQLMTFSRQQNLKPECLDPTAVLVEFEALASHAAGQTIELAFDLDPATRPIFVDATEFQAAVLNLVGNARDAMPHGGTLRITSRNVTITADSPHTAETPPGLYVQVDVSDTGTGMTAETQAKAFEPFFTTKPVGSGTGLGLSQVYGFARSAGGAITVRSTLGRGTTFSLFLPASAADRASPAQPVPSAPIDDAQGQTILVVEDDAEVANSTAESLRDLGYAVLTAGTAAAAMELLATGVAFDILFSDVVMPGGSNGIELAAAAKRLRPGLPVLLTSGYTGANLREVPASLPLLKKPYGREDLWAALQAARHGPASAQGTTRIHVCDRPNSEMPI